MGLFFKSAVLQGDIGVVKYAFDGRMVVDFERAQLKFTKAEREHCLEKVPRVQTFESRPFDAL